MIVLVEFSQNWYHIWSKLTQNKYKAYMTEKNSDTMQIVQKILIQLYGQIL